MLGCHDFCGYYDWTFSHVRENFGDDALHRLWSQAIGEDSQRAYLEAARSAGLRGLLEVWTKTGQDEQCDWTFTLDAQRNVLRWDMRRCPSKGFLLEHDLNADEDYCDHCIGWIAPLLAKAGIEVAAHEHNHRGQCWAELRVRGKAYAPLKVACDIRDDARWRQGYVDSFIDGQRDGTDPQIAAMILTDQSYADGAEARPPAAVVLGEDELLIRRVAERYLATPPGDRPALLHAYFPRGASIDFLAHGLPRPIALLPILIRAGVYEHVPGAAHPDVARQRERLIAAVTRPSAA